MSNFQKKSYVTLEWPVTQCDRLFYLSLCCSNGRMTKPENLYQDGRLEQFNNVIAWNAAVIVYVTMINYVSFM